MATKQQVNEATFFLVAIPKGSGETYPPPDDFPPNRVWYIRTENNDLLVSEDETALVQEKSAT